MISYLIRRMLFGVVTLWMVTFIIYGLVRNMPGDPVMNKIAASGARSASACTI